MYKNVVLKYDLTEKQTKESTTSKKEFVGDIRKCF